MRIRHQEPQQHLFFPFCDKGKRSCLHVIRHCQTDHLWCDGGAAKKKVEIPKFPLVKKKQFPFIKKAQAPPAVAGATPAVSGAPVVNTGVTVGRRMLQE